MPFDLLPGFALAAFFEELRAAGFFAVVFAVAVLLVDREGFAGEPDLPVVFVDLVVEDFDLVPVLFEGEAFDFDAADFAPVLEADALAPDFAADAFVPDFADEVFDPDLAAADDFDDALFRAVEVRDFEPPDFELGDFFVVAILFSSATRNF